MLGSSQEIIYIQHTDGSKILIRFPSDRKAEITTSWLLNEAITKLKNTFPEVEGFDNIVTLQTINADFVTDSWLSVPGNNLSNLKSETVLKPFYKQEISRNSEQGQSEVRISLQDFILEASLGRGAFSHVYLVRKKDTGVLYALKQIKKAGLTARKKKLVVRERQAMLDIASHFTVQLHYAFQTKNHFYFVQEFLPLGDMRRLLLGKMKLSEKDVRFYIAETILGIEAIHNKSYIFRDLKPENLLLDHEGHVRITDFGLAKRVPDLRELNYSYCGTFEILAPEITGDVGYGHMVDYFNIGTLAYEMATGYIPEFTKVERALTKYAQERMNVLSKECKDFLSRLLESNPKCRLGFTNGVKELLAHPWMSPLDINSLKQRKVKPPFEGYAFSVKFFPLTIELDELDIIGCLPSDKGHKEENNDIPYFSFYGNSDANSIPTQREVSGKLVGFSLKLSAESRKFQQDSFAKRMEEVEENLQLTEREVSDDDNGSIAKKYAEYKMEAAKSMKMITRFPKLGKNRFVAGGLV